MEDPYRFKDRKGSYNSGCLDLNIRGKKCRRVTSGGKIILVKKSPVQPKQDPRQVRSKSVGHMFFSRPNTHTPLLLLKSRCRSFISRTSVFAHFTGRKEMICVDSVTRTEPLVSYPSHNRGLVGVLLLQKLHGFDLF